MKVLHVTESRGWSGGTVQLWALCEALAADRHEVALVCPPGSRLAAAAAKSRVTVQTLELRQDYDVVAARALAKIARGFKPDIVHAHHPRAHAVALLASLFGPIPRLVVSRRVSFHLKRWNLFSQWKYRSSKIKTYIAVSDDIREVLMQGGVPGHKIALVHSGVDTQKFAPRPANEALRAQLRIPPGVPVIGNVTHYSWWKGQSYFLEAARKVIDMGVPAHFLLAGKDTDSGDALHRTHALNLDKHVTLAGFRQDMPDVLSILSASVVSSLAGEGFSGVIRESMCMGIPVVATAVGGNGELVVDGKTGFLVPPANADALAAALRRVLTERERAVEMARQAQINVRSNFSIETMVKKTIRLYETLTHR